MLHWIIRKILGRIAAMPVRRRLRAFEEATHRPREVQEALRHAILFRQAGTDFGKEHHFAEIQSTGAFRRHLPVGKVKDPDAKYYLALRSSLLRRVGMIIAANPSTLVNLARAGDHDKEALIRDIHDGTLSERFDIPAEVRAALARRLRKAHPE